MSASACSAYDCSVCYAWHEASPENLAAPGAAGYSHPSVTSASMSALMRVFFSLKLTLLLCCSPLAPSFARVSACSFPYIPQWAGIHCRTALLIAATSCMALARSGCFWFGYVCTVERALERKTICLQS